MIKKIDTNSEEFQFQLQLTKEFTKKVLEDHNLSFNLDDEINQGIQMGLTRNKIIYDERFCPCFMVIGETKEEQLQSDNRICPCTPALTNEIPQTGSCHCGIFNTKEKIEKMKDDESSVNSSFQYTGLSKQECEELLSLNEINTSQLESLLEARDSKIIDFNLVDNREWMEWVDRRIKGTDFLVPTTSFYQAIEQLNSKKHIPTIVYCFAGSRSAYCQKIMLDLGFKSVTNLDYGISSYGGECERGEE